MSDEIDQIRSDKGSFPQPPHTVDDIFGSVKWVSKWGLWRLCCFLSAFQMHSSLVPLNTPVDYLFDWGF